MRAAVFIIAFFIIGFNRLNAQNIPDETILFNKMLHAMENVKSCSFKLKLTEYIKGEVFDNYHTVKMQTEPFKAYVYCIDPNPGAEALYLEGKNNNKILINPNRFPFFNLSLHENNMLLRKDHPYSMTQLGFTYILPLLKAYVAREGLPFYNRLSCTREIMFDNRKFFLLEIHNPQFDYITYTVKKNETLSGIAQKLLVNDRMIMVHNPGIRNYDAVKEGTVLKVPNSFAKKIEFYIDEQNFLPMVQVVYDEKGIYTRIEFTGYINNPVFKAEEFTTEYKDYNF